MYRGQLVPCYCSFFLQENKVEMVYADTNPVLNKVYPLWLCLSAVMCVFDLDLLL